jgi:hypothetical protein
LLLAPRRLLNNPASRGVGIGLGRTAAGGCRVGPDPILPDCEDGFEWVD